MFIVFCRVSIYGLLNGKLSIVIVAFLVIMFANLIVFVFPSKLVCIVKKECSSQGEFHIPIP